MKAISLEFPGFEEIYSKLEIISKKINEMQSQNPQKEWLSNEEASEFLNVTTRTMQKYRDNGIIPFSKLGSKVYYKLEDLNALLESNYFEAFNQEGRV